MLRIVSYLFLIIAECSSVETGMISCESCGLHSLCKIRSKGVFCTCLPGYMGTPPFCSPESCVFNSKCHKSLSCISNKCIDPCHIGSCGLFATCVVENHAPICSCRPGYFGDPKIKCIEKARFNTSVSTDINLCEKNISCGSNVVCRIQGHCVCDYGYSGDPYVKCEPGCKVDSDCRTRLSCVNKKCVNPCNGIICGINEICVNNLGRPICVCKQGFEGVPCNTIEIPSSEPSPCEPSPCGLNSNCKESRIDGVAVCACMSGFKGKPPYCVPESIDTIIEIPSSEPSPCEPSPCGLNSNCKESRIDGVAVCACMSGFKGKPPYCVPESIDTIIEIPSSEPSPCEPSPCGLNSNCKESRIDGVAVCACMSGFKGKPPYCKPEPKINPIESSGPDQWLIIGCSVALGMTIISTIAAVIVWKRRKSRKSAHTLARQDSEPIYEEIYEAASSTGASSVPEVAALPPCPPPREAEASSEPEVAARPACPLPKEAVWQENVYDIVYESRVQRLWESRWFAFVRSERLAEVRRLAASMPRPRD